MSQGQKPFTLYWSPLSTYEDCPQKFLWGRGWGQIDVGGGPGKRKPRPVQKSEHHAVLGIVIQGVIERFYNDELWKMLAPVALRDRLLEMAEQDLNLELARKFVDWKMAPSRNELSQTVREGILGYMKTLKAHRLLGPYARAEVDLVAYANKYTPIGGRADVIIRREDTGVSIIDGKNGKRYKDGKGGMMMYTDPDQLRWYALLFYLCYHQMPDRVGFVPYRYPYGTPILDDDGNDTGQIEPGVDWVPFSKEDLKGLAQRAVDARKSMDKEVFPAKPEPKKCKFCDFETVCPERMAQKDANRRTPKAADPAIATMPGFTMLSFGQGRAE